MDILRKSLFYCKYKITNLKRKTVIRLFQETSWENDSNIWSKGTQNSEVYGQELGNEMVGSPT